MLFNSLRRIAKDFKLFESEGGSNSNAPNAAATNAENLAKDETEVINKLDRSVKFDEVDTVTFGLETDDGKIVKVYVNAEQAETFEKALAAKLGEIDDIEEVLNELSKEYEIIDVEWPEDGEDDEETEDGIEDDGSSALDQKVYGPKPGKGQVEDNGDKQFPSESMNYGEEVSLALLESSSNIESRFTTAAQLMVYHAILDLGVPEIALARNPYRAAIIKGIKESAEHIQKNGAMKIAIKQFIRGSIDFEKKAKENEKENRSETHDKKPVKAEEKPVKEEIKLTEDKVEWNFSVSKGNVNISCSGISLILDSEETEKLIKGINNHTITVVRDETESPAKKAVFSPRGKSMLVKMVGSAEGYLMTSKDIEDLLHTLSKEVNEDITFTTPKDIENLNPGTKAINGDTIKILNRKGLSTLKGNLKKHGYEHKGSAKGSEVYKKSRHSVGIEWDENEGTGTATMWKD